MDGNVMRAKSSNDLLVESIVSAPADNDRSGEGVPTLSESEHLKRDISSGGITVHIDADIKVPKITGDIRTYSAQYRFLRPVRARRSVLLRRRSDVQSRARRKRRRTIRLPGCSRADFISACPKFLSASNHPTALKPGWAKGCNISPDDARRLSV